MKIFILAVIAGIIIAVVLLKWVIPYICELAGK